METFNYYKRGKGELNTSNFVTLASQSSIVVYKMDSKTFVSLLALQMFKQQSRIKHCLQPVFVESYVEHMRGDKDVFPASTVYSTLNTFSFTCLAVQHESTGFIKSGFLSKKEVFSDIDVCPLSTTFIGADSSVPRFFPGVDAFAVKEREGGKVLQLQFDTDLIDLNVADIVIVDDLLGGGATVQMLVGILRKEGYKGGISLWVRYNEGIHKDSFLNQFSKAYLGDEV